MPEQNESSRSRCERCLRPAFLCLCGHIAVVPHRTRVLILQHPDEAKHPLNTARLAALGLQHAELLIGEHFAQLNARVESAGQALLLFPDRRESAGDSVAQARAADAPSLLIVPDGTWRMARKIVRANPLLGTLPRLALPVGAASEYRVRKAREPAAVSTIEAIVRALSLLEPQGNFEQLLRPFQVLVQQQIEAMGPEVYRRNYS